MRASIKLSMPGSSSMRKGIRNMTHPLRTVWPDPAFLSRSTLSVGGAVLKTMRAKSERTPAEEVVLARWTKMHAENLTHFRKLRDAGVAFVAGTDAGWRFTAIDDMPMEISLLHEGGMTPLEAIVAGTGFAAKVIGIDDRAGALTAGLLADVIVVGGNPLDDLDVLRDIRMVMQGGRLKTVHHPSRFASA